MIKEIELGIQFLQENRSRQGWWQDFDTLAGRSDEWVTAYVGSMLTTLPVEAAQLLAKKAWRLLCKRRWFTAGWGYNRWVPADADSTGWACRLANQLGVSNLKLHRALKFLRSHCRANGALSTYAEDGPIRLFTQMAQTISFAGWCGAHPSVTALVAGLQSCKMRAPALNYLRSTQSTEGHWSGYWWCDPAYPTLLTVEALAQTGIDHIHLQRAVAWARRSASELSLPFEAACRLGILVQLPGNGDATQVLVDGLRSSQEPDGSWQASARLRILPPFVTAPDSFTGWVFGARGGGSIQVDWQRCFTTATVVRALYQAEIYCG